MNLLNYVRKEVLSSSETYSHSKFFEVEETNNIFIVVFSEKHFLYLPFFFWHAV
jgi:hypothetical protein